MGSSLLSWTLRLGRIRGISIEVHWTFIVFILIDLLRSSSLNLAFWFSAAWFVSILVHELGHCAMARRLKLQAERIVMWPLGGLAYVSPGRNRVEEILIALAGPFMHIPLGLLCAAFLLSHGTHLGLSDMTPFMGGRGETFGIASGIVYQIMQMQIFLFCFNVFLPAYPMDGGRVLVAALSRWCSRETTARISLVVTGCIGIFLMVEGATILGFCLIWQAVSLMQVDQAGQLRHHPMFAFNPGPVTSVLRGRKPAALPKGQKAVVLQFRPRAGGEPESSVFERPDSSTRACPHCARAIPEKAVMCGFCEREV